MRKLFLFFKFLILKFALSVCPNYPNWDSFSGKKRLNERFDIVIEQLLFGYNPFNCSSYCLVIARKNTTWKGKSRKITVVALRHINSLDVL